MHRAVARVETPRADRYLAQMCDHLGNMRSGFLGRIHRRPDHGGHGSAPVVRSVERGDDRGRIEFDWGSCVLSASPDGLTVQVQADDLDALRRGQQLIGQRIETIGRREHLTVDWEPPATG